MLVYGRKHSSRDRIGSHSSPRRLPVSGHLLLVAVFSSMLVTVGSAVAFGQSGSSTGRESLIDELFQSLLKSERERRTSDPDVRRDVPAVAPRSANPDPDMVQIRRGLSSFAQEAARLTAGLDTDLAHVPGIRPYFGDALQVRAAATVLADRSGEVHDRSLIRSDYESLDRKWRVLAYRLRQINGLDRTCLQRIDRLDEFNTSLGRLFQTQPQLNRTELIRQTAALAVDLQNLLEDIEIELEQSPTRNVLLIEGRKVQQQARHVAASIAEPAPHNRIVEDYRQFQTMWYPLAAQLRPFENGYLERSIRRINHADRTAQELLWMPQQIDRQQLLHLTKLLEKNVDEFFSRAPLKLLIELPDAAAVLSTADEFYGVFENFTDTVNRGEDHAALVDSFRYIDDSWKSFRNVFRSMKSRKAQEVLTQIELSVDALREAMLLNEGFDYRQAIELAASLENLSESVNVLTRRWVNESRPSFRTAALQEADTFSQLSRQFHANLVNRNTTTDLRAECSKLYDNWRRVYQYISQCKTEDRPRLGRMASQVTPALVELRTILGL